MHLVARPSGIAANTIGALVATPASYELNRNGRGARAVRATYGARSCRFGRSPSLAFWARPARSNSLTTCASPTGITGLPRSLAIMGASLFAYGVVWIVSSSSSTWSFSARGQLALAGTPPPEAAYPGSRRERPAPASGSAAVATPAQWQRPVRCTGPNVTAPPAAPRARPRDRSAVGPVETSGPRQPPPGREEPLDWPR